MKKSKMMAVAVDTHEEKPSASIRLGENLAFPRLSIGKTVRVTIAGKVTHISDEEWNRGFSLQIRSVENESGMGSDMEKMKKSRSMMDYEDDED